MASATGSSSSKHGFAPPPPSSSSHFPTTSSSQPPPPPTSSSLSRASISSSSSYAPSLPNGSGQQRVGAPLHPSSVHLPHYSIFEDTLCKYILLGGRGCYGKLFETRKAALAFVKSSIKNLSTVEDRRIEFLIDSCPVLEGIWLPVMKSELARGTGYLEICIEVEEEEGEEEGNGFEVKLYSKKAKLSHPAPPTQLVQQPSNSSFSRAPPSISLPPQQQQPAFIPRPAHYPPLASTSQSSNSNSQFFRQPSISSHSRNSSTASATSESQGQPRRSSQPRQPSLTSSHIPLGAQQHQPVQHQQPRPPPPSRQSLPSSSAPYAAYQQPSNLSYAPPVVFQQPFEPLPPQQPSSSSSRPIPSSHGGPGPRNSLPDGWTGSPPPYLSTAPLKVALAQVAKGGVVAEGTGGGEEKKEKKARKPSPYNHFYATAYPRVKLARPDLENAEIIREVAKQWAEEPDNPKNLKANRRDERPLTLYSEFYTVEYAREKALHPEVSFEDRNRTVAELWAESPRNPKNFSRYHDASSSTTVSEAQATAVALMAIQVAAAVNNEIENGYDGEDSREDGQADGMGEVVDSEEGGES
ncbi:hypothetical protein BDY24DRAFT_388404 [Mrakia frigida]|uniref:HMG-box domain-containing protein n=1 Tax=Mrakia frigida TaxID=29902 RepID=UPI003FCC02CD